MGDDAQFSYSEMHIGNIESGSMATTEAPGFNGYLQQLTFNGEKLFELAKTGQLAIQHSVSIRAHRILFSSSIYLGIDLISLTF